MHINLTEIIEYLDLFWRNIINPAKLNIGLAFYLYTFVASDLGYIASGYTFDIVGDPGPYTNSPGTLSNAELIDVINQAGAKPTLNKDAAV